MQDPDEIEIQAPNPLKGAAKTGRLKRLAQVKAPSPRKPPWIRARAPNSPEVAGLKAILRGAGLHTVCEEAACPNIGECFSHGTATFMILGNVCTRCCPFCDVAHGKPLPPDPGEPDNLARTVAAMGLRHVVVTSVDRDDLADRGAGHFVTCIRAIRRESPGTVVEVLVPDFRNRVDAALDILAEAPPDVFNHNLETVPRLYGLARPGAVYTESLALLRRFKTRFAHVPSKSGLMLGLGERREEVVQVMNDLVAHGCEMLTLGQYLQPTKDHLPVDRYVTPDEFAELGALGRALGFTHVASGPMVRSSYHADKQITGKAPPGWYGSEGEATRKHD